MHPGVHETQVAESPYQLVGVAALPLHQVHCLLHDDDDNTLSYDVAVSSPPLDVGSSPVVLPGSPVSPTSSPSPPASMDEAAAVLYGPDEIQQQPESDNATLRMPLDHTRLLEDQARLLRSLLRDPPSDESWAQCEEAWMRAVALAVEAVRLLPGKPVGVKHPSGQVVAELGHRTLASEPQNRKTSSDPPNTQQDQQPSSPVFRVLKQSRDPNLRNPLNDIFGTLGQDYGMQLDKPDLKRPHQSSASSSDEVGNLCKQAATETPQTEGPSGSKLPDT
ncbi:hypothetical protein HPB51_028071 [Rhipicephalus microplus]|uniref:Uncharacterized protein n=1 Tax=Rhipicephalus microplus TaxID=6941 RepID=A0A9J6CY02_RHIMP|nr:hypothetical protein HPB51_028071 [Rhipicephalus microplus]